MPCNRNLAKFILVGWCATLWANSAFGIISGTEVSQGDPLGTTSVAFIQEVASNSEYPGGVERDACSGVIFSANVILTAAHCIKESPIGKTISFGTDIYSPSPATRQIDHYAVDPDFRDGYANQPVVPRNNSDIAVLHFSGDLPAGFKAADLLPTDYRITGQEQVVIAGYGIVEPPKVDSNGVVIDPYAWLGDGILRKAGAAILDPSYAATEIQVRETDQGYASTGDSGGPAFIVVGGRPLLVGVDNWGNRQAGTPFEVYADVRSHLSWINSVIGNLRN
jgi:hypothetical protein